MRNQRTKGRGWIRPWWRLAAALLLVAGALSGLGVAPAAAAFLCPTEWTEFPVPANPDTTELTLHAVTRAGSDVWAVGEERSLVPGDPWTRPLIERFDGSGWERVDTPSLAHGGYLIDVAANGADDVWAVGLGNGGLALHWAGTAWDEVTVPTPPTATSVGFFSVDVLGSATYILGNSDQGPFLSVKDDDGWTSEFLSTPPETTVMAITASPDGDLWISGYFDVDGPDDELIQAFVLQWDGATWFTHALGADVELIDMDAVAGPNGVEVWAVGWWLTGSPEGTPMRPLGLRWDGTQWHEMAVALPEPGFLLIAGVSAVATDDVWMVGRAEAPGGNTQSLAVHWDGTSLVTTTSPEFVTPLGGMRDVVAAPGGPVWAVGGDAHDTRAQWRCGPPGPPPPLPWDAEGSVHAPAIGAAISAGIAAGFADHTYRPDSPLTRGQMATFLARAWYLTADAAAPPDEPVTRAQMATFLARALDLPPGGPVPADAAGSPHAGAIGAVIQAGIATGFADGTYRPDTPVTRGQMATFLTRALDLL